MTARVSVLNGVREDGSYAYGWPDDDQIAHWLEPPAPPPKSRFRAPARGVDPDDLASAGWAVIYAPGKRAQCEPALRPLLERRQDEAGDLYQAIELYPNESCDYFLERHRANMGNADPHRLPYYLLLVGDPEEIPFQFQGQLDQVFAVGRLHFDCPRHYSAYARAVRESELATAPKPRRRIAVFGALNKGDDATRRTTERLIEPLAFEIERRLKGRVGWQLEKIVGAAATREALAGVLSRADAPDLVFTASHGMVFDPSDSRQSKLQGALLCSDWQGPDHPATRECYLAAEDLALGNRPLLGAITFHLACHSGGTPEWDSFQEPGTGDRRRLAPEPFVSALAQRLLGDGGASAVVAHADRAWTTSFDWDPLEEEPDPKAFLDTILPLVDGCRVGDATESFGSLYGLLAAQLMERRGLACSRERKDPARESRLWRATNDIRSFVVYGDPAVRLRGAER